MKGNKNESTNVQESNISSSDEDAGMPPSYSISTSLAFAPTTAPKTKLKAPISTLKSS